MITSGRVNEESGEGLIGANIFLAGTYDGASSMANGHLAFSILFPDNSTARQVICLPRLVRHLFKRQDVQSIT